MEAPIIGQTFSLPDALDIPPSRKFELVTLDNDTFKGVAKIVNGKLKGLRVRIQFSETLKLFLYPI